MDEAVAGVAVHMLWMLVGMVMGLAIGLVVEARWHLYERAQTWLTSELEARGWRSTGSGPG